MLVCTGSNLRVLLCHSCSCFSAGAHFALRLRWGLVCTLPMLAPFHAISRGLLADGAKCAVYDPKVAPIQVRTLRVWQQLVSTAPPWGTVLWFGRVSQSVGFVLCRLPKLWGC